LAAPDLPAPAFGAADLGAPDFALRIAGPGLAALGRFGAPGFFDGAAWAVALGFGFAQPAL
jgi:hypothetical protein